MKPCVRGKREASDREAPDHILEVVNTRVDSCQANQRGRQETDDANVPTHDEHNRGRGGQQQRVV